MSRYSQFRFKNYAFDASTGTLELNYGYDEALSFTETYRFDFPFASYDPDVLDRTIQLLFFIAGVSYYKMYLAPEISIETGQIDSELAAFLSKTYQNGLGEFFAVNNLDPRTKISFPVNADSLQPLAAGGLGLLVGLGGGKDSLVSVEILNSAATITTWSLNHRSQLEPLATAISSEHLWVERTWDPQIATLNQQDALNGHVPISAIFSAVGAVVAILSGKRDALVSNESSASEPTLEYQGVSVNHQYSKSLEYEIDFQAILRHLFADTLRYYSFLRPFTELRIAELFAQHGFQKYRTVFSSCNRAFTHGQDHMSWCGECAKCAFVFLILTPFVDQADLEKLWSGKNLLLDPSLEQTYKQLLGIEGDKPFDCVGEIKEARAAMRLAQQTYPELAKYTFELPDDYDFRAWSEHRIPAEILDLLKQTVS